MADTLVVMYLGKIVESGKTHEIFKQPHHPYTKALMEAKPSFDNEENTKAKGLDGSSLIRHDHRRVSFPHPV